VKGAALALLLLAAGCGARQTDTALVVAVSSELAFPAIDELTIDVATSGEPVTRRYDVDRNTTFPIQLGVVPKGKPDFEVTIAATGLLQGKTVVSQVAVVAFDAGAPKTVPLLLSASCQSRTCGATDSCVRGQCVDRRMVVTLNPAPTMGDAGVTDAPPGAAGDAAVERTADMAPRREAGMPGTWSQEKPADIAAAGADVSLNGVFAVRSDDVWAVGWTGIKGLAFHFDGKAWTASALPAGTLSLYQAWGTPGGDVWAVGLNGTIMRRMGGQWRSVPSGASANLSGVWGSAADDVWAVGTMGAVLRWNGTMWAPAAVGVDAAVALLQITGIARNQMWAVGSMGSVFRFDGTRWQKQDHGLTTNPLFGVWASSADDVWAVGDRVGMHFDGARWRTTTGLPQSARAVWGSAPDDLWAVGDGGPGGQSMSHFDGDAWTPFKGPSTDALQSVHGVASADAWAVGPKGTLLRLGR
jgi:hypothetical protein